MSRSVATIAESETRYGAVDQMCRRKVRRLPVLDREGALVGIVTDRDVRHRLFAPNLYQQIGEVPVSTLLRQAPVRGVMSAPVRCNSAAADVAEAAERMRRDSLSVVEGPRLAGMLTELDVLRSIVGGDAPGSPELDIVIASP